MPLPQETVKTPHQERIWLSRLRLTDFRNYRHLTIDLDGRPVVLTGENGAGKTNLLEAISLLSPGRGMRGTPFVDLARFDGSSLWAVSARLQGPDGPIDVGTGLELSPDGSPVSGRIVKIDGHPVKGSGKLSDLVQIVWLTPTLDGLFTGAASERRRFLDRLIIGLDPGFRQLSNQFERAMRQRNKLLDTGSRDDSQFSGLETLMAETGAALAAARLEAVDHLAHAIISKWPAITPEGKQSPFPWSTLTLEGELEHDLRIMPSAEAEDHYLRALRENRERDRAAKRTLIGPHRSDFLTGHGPKKIPAKFCSTGEQKALLVGLILAHAELLRDLHGTAPIILLDEISAHLDESRRKALFKEILSLSSQAFMTGTDADIFSPFGDGAQFYSLGNAAIVG
jgi:DNA replication and repair protein RecF